MKYSFILLLIFYVGQTSAFASAQLPDNIIYKGKKYDLNCNPLESYFEIHPDKRPNNTKVIVTSILRGYVATFKIKKGQLYIKDIKMCLRNGRRKSVLNEVFPNQKNIKAEWFSGLLVLPHGNIVNQGLMGYGVTFEKYTLLEIDKGILKKDKQLNLETYEQFKEKQFQVFKKTPKYSKLKSDFKKNNQSDKWIEAFIRHAIVEYTSKLLVE